MVEGARPSGAVGCANSRPRAEVKNVELKVWTPFLDMEKEMRSMRERFPRVFGEMSPFEHRPATDITREDGTLVVTTELPGVDPEKDVEIMVEGDVLVIKGEKSTEKEVTEKDMYLHERHFGAFQRRIPLPDGVDPDSVTASFDKGILTVRVPLPAETTSEPRRISVDVS